MDRVHIMNKKKNVTYKEGMFSPHSLKESEVDSAYVVSLYMNDNSIDKANWIFGILFQRKVWYTEIIRFCQEC